MSISPDPTKYNKAATPPHCIAISGFDGSGKTTLADLLVKYLASRGYKSRYVWIKSQHTLAYLIIRALMALGWIHTYKNPSGITVSRFKVYKGTFAEKIWPIIEFASVLPVIIIRVRLPLLLGRKIVLDRYTIDTIVSVALNTQNIGFAGGSLANALLRLMPKDCNIVYLDVDIPTVLKRRPDIEYSYDEVKNALQLYRTLAKRMNALSLDTADFTIEQTRNIILDIFFVPDWVKKTQFNAPPRMDFSIVIPTINRAANLKALLTSILGQKALPKEVIIVDQSDDSSTVELSNEMRKSFSEANVRLKYLHIKQKSGSKARNIGISHSTGGIVFFVDDDVVLSKDYTQNILKVYRSHPDAIGVQGLIFNPERSPKFTSTLDGLENQIRRAFFLSHYRQNIWTIMPSINDIFPFPITSVILTQRMQGCCTYRREILDAFKYDENIRGWAFLEDLDLSYRIFRSNLGSLYVTPYARMLHREHHASSSLKEEAHKKVVNRAYMFFKLTDQSFRNYVIFSWSIFGFLLTTILGSALRRHTERSKRLSVYLIEAALYTLKHLNSIKQLNPEILDISPQSEYS